MHDIRQTKRKIARYQELINLMVYRVRQPLRSFRFRAGSDFSVGSDVEDAHWPMIEPNSSWGAFQQDFTLRTHFTVPKHWRMPVILSLPIGNDQRGVKAFMSDWNGAVGIAEDDLLALPPLVPNHVEAMAYIDGHAYQGMDAFHREILLPARCCNGYQHSLALQGHIEQGPALMGQAEIVQVCQPTRDFATSARVALDVIWELEDHDPIRVRLLNTLDQAFRQLHLHEPLGEDFYNSIRDAQSVLDRGLAKAGSPLDVDIVAMGQAHMDVAWLWRVRRTREKTARTFTNVLKLMEQFPEYYFSQTQPLLYEYVQQDHPEIFDEIKQRVAEGRWEPISGMWIEPDCNLSGAESLVRQFLLGRAYFQREFGPGADSPVLFLLDAFGLPASLPQLTVQAGLRFFTTSKIGCSQYNRLPYDTFWWEGLDGTRILTHLNTVPGPDGRACNSISDQSPRAIRGAWKNYQQKDLNSELLIYYGWGDGGGGPTRELLENSRRMARHPGVPRVRLGKAIEFFENLETHAERFPVWNGELYLEYHRGVYSSQAQLKRANRKCEFLLHNAEFLAAWASQVTGCSYPSAELTRAWKLLCVNQFHDIIAGACIAEVNADTLVEYEAIRSIGKEVQDAALEALSCQIPKTVSFVAINPISFGGHHIGLLPERLEVGQTLTKLDSSEPLVVQAVENGTLVAVTSMEPYGGVALVLKEEPSQSRLPEVLKASRCDQGGAVLENDLLLVELDDSGALTRLLDKGIGREVLPAGQRANLFQAFQDRPLNRDAWNIEIFYEEKQWDLAGPSSLTPIEHGPLRAGMEICRRLLSSEMVQRVYLHRGSRRIDFETKIVWQDRHVLLKVAFPVNILSPVATYDIQWGNVERPTHRNTSWDYARFETCAHKWIDLSEGNYGVSLLNDCKYGHDVHGNILRLTLLKSASFPDPNAEQGEHCFTYSLLPHPGDWRGVTAAASYSLNNPLILKRVKPSGTGCMIPRSLVAVENANVIIETVKQAENGQGLVVRLYENERTRSEVKLTTGFRLARAFQCNLLEENEQQLQVGGNESTFMIKPYQILTIRLVPASQDCSL